MLIGSDSVHYVIKWITKGWRNAGGGQAVRGGSYVAHLEALDSLASEDAIQTVEASQIDLFFKVLFLDLIVDTG